MLKCCSPITCNSYVKDVKSCKISDFPGFSGSHLGHKSLNLLNFLEMDVFLHGFMQQEWIILLCKVQYSPWEAFWHMHVSLDNWTLPYLCCSFWIFHYQCQDLFMLERNASNSQHIQPKTPGQQFPKFKIPWTSLYKDHNIQTLTSYGLPSMNSFLTCPFIFIRYWLDLPTKQNWTL